MTDPPVTLITGGASGIRAATARRLLTKGNEVMLGALMEVLRTFYDLKRRPAGGRYAAVRDRRSPHPRIHQQR